MLQSLNRLKASAKKICKIVRANGTDINLSQCQDFVAQMAGFESYHYLLIACEKGVLNLHRKVPNDAAIHQFISDFQLDLPPETFSDLVQPKGLTQPDDEPLRGVAGDDWM